MEITFQNNFIKSDSFFIPPIGIVAL